MVSSGRVFLFYLKGDRVFFFLLKLGSPREGFSIWSCPMGGLKKGGIFCLKKLSKEGGTKHETNFEKNMM